MISRFSIISALIILSSLLARADILFIDFNLSEKEVAAAQNAARVRGEELVVFPNVNPKIRKYIDDVEVYKNKVIQNIKKCKTDDACTLKYAKLYAQAQFDQTNILAQIPFGAEALSEFLNQMDREGRRFTAFIESGHAGAAQFAGYFPATISHEELAKVVEGKSSLQTVKTALYWGCYSMSIGAVKNRWPKIFPQAHLIAGFDEVGPSGERKESSVLLAQILTQEDAAIATGNNLNALKVFFRKIQYSRDTNLALSIDYNTYVSNHHALYLADAAMLCSIEKYIVHAQTIRCYANATDPMCANPPENTASGVLRASYTATQGMEHCFDSNSRLISENEHMYPEFTLRLMFFNSVKINYAKFHKKDLEQLDLELSQAGISSDLLLSNLAQMNRSQIVSRVKRLMEAKAGLSERLQTAIAEINYSLVDLNPLAIPQSWIEPDAREGIPSEDRFRM